MIDGISASVPPPCSDLRRASLCRGRAPRWNRGRRTGAGERIAADRADHEPVGGESAGTQRTLQEIGLAIIRSERRALYRGPGSQRTRSACALADRLEFDVRQGGISRSPHSRSMVAIRRLQ